jgi:4-hydroxy-tetrahydrodipicolinate reductase
LSSRPRIHLAGATGRTGNAIAHALAARSDVQLVSCIAPSLAGLPTRAVPASVAGFPSVSRISDVRAGDVLVDVSIAAQVPGHLAWAREHGVHVVLGTTGCDETMLHEAGTQFAAAGLALMVVPNFSIGAVLMMRLAAEASRWLEHVEIIEVHHDTKVDAPSGTAIRTAQMIAAARHSDGIAESDVDATAVSEARGLLVDGTRVHSVRLPGATAHQDVVFGSPGELLTIRHDAIDRSCYAAGVVLAAHAVASCTGLHIGLEELL